MKKKLLIALLATTTVTACAFSFTACGGGENDGTHKHNYVYRSNGNGTHLQYCINDGCDIPKDKYENITCADKNGDGLCDACGYKLGQGEQEGENNKPGDNKPGESGDNSNPGDDDKTDDKEQGGQEGVGKDENGDNEQQAEVFVYTLNEDGISYSVKAGEGAAKATEIVIPSTYEGLPVTTVGSFKDCSKLASITIPDSVTSVGSFTGTAYYENENNWQNGVLYIGKHLLKAKKEISGSYQIKSGTRTISSSAFYGCEELTELTIPDSVVTIGSAAFYNCNKMTSVKIGNSVTTIGYSAFQDCSALTSVILPDSLTSLGYTAFFRCSNLTSIVIPVGVKDMGVWMFNSTDLEKIYYGGTADEWEEITGSGVPSDSTPRYYYSETQPEDAGNYWHYVNGEVVEW